MLPVLGLNICHYLAPWSTVSGFFVLGHYSRRAGGELLLFIIYPHQKPPWDYQQTERLSKQNLDYGALGLGYQIFLSFLNKSWGG
jgi:hypothetical protein